MEKAEQIILGAVLTSIVISAMASVVTATLMLEVVKTLKAEPRRQQIDLFASFAYATSTGENNIQNVPERATDEDETEVLEINTLVKDNEGNPVGLIQEEKITRIVTAYNSVPWQTDDTPCIGAFGDDLCVLHKVGDLSCAADLEYGTKLWIPPFQNWCTVRDRMARKFKDRVDLFMGDDIEGAKKFGKQKLTLTILHL